MNTWSDEDLYRAAMAGDVAAFGQIVQRYQDAVFGVAVARLHNFHEAQDIAQDVFVEAFQKLASLRDPRRLSGWLRAITIHHCLDRMRRKELEEQVQHEPQPADFRAEPTPPENAQKNELRQRVLDAIACLSKAQQETATLFYINGYSVDQIATMQEVPAGTVKRRLHDARAKLKEEMLAMVEDTLKSESPKEDFGQRVFDLVNRFGGGPRPTWTQMVTEIRRIGAAGLGGFSKALGSAHSRTRTMALNVLPQSGESAERALELLEDGLADPNRKVRRFALSAALYMKMDEARRRAELVPLTLPLLTDRSLKVRQMAAWHLQWFADAVPLEAVAKALLAERHPGNQACLKDLMRRAMAAGEAAAKKK